ncbi:response regulator transcription factor [Profundibacterium mesophilum]|uniref:Two component transcriptional regulator LuxR family protein n=1 Tax=Profundibacterium mesophilum KAUST100406-0324 TaxID=1037889 RepID=A0A921TC84_9RHOB|nr:response regulator transcription factor [Profundibacterium mesophilum]KAF0676785.1 Two component transcriptional regulator LuxR family protein [Profundibacterium mesophilum KAUST100406-0324]
MDVLIADDHDLVRDTIAAFLTSRGSIHVQVAGSLGEALERIEAEGAFDIVLLDYDMPGMHKLEGLGRAIACNGGKPVGIVSGTATPAIAQDALAAGAAGFLPKTMSGRSLVNAVKFMAAGEIYAPVEFMAATPCKAEHPLHAQLTKREREVLSGLSMGKANKEIARDLDLEEVTIKVHVKTLSRKLSARNRTHAVVIAKEAGFI